MLIQTGLLVALAFAAWIFIRFMRPVGRRAREQLCSVCEGSERASEIARIAMAKRWLSACEWRLSMRQGARIVTYEALCRAGVDENRAAKSNAGSRAKLT